MSDNSDEEMPLARVRAEVLGSSNDGEPFRPRQTSLGTKRLKRVNKSVIKCGRCMKKCKSCDEYMNHSCSGPTTFYCDICSSPYFSFKRLSKHIEAHFDRQCRVSKNFTCDFCRKVFSIRSKLQVHLLKEHFSIEHRCDKCGRYFVSEENLAVHKCRNGAPLPCPQCGLEFTRKNLLKKHCLTHSNLAWRCEFCYNMFMKESTYKAHMSKLNCSKTARNDWLIKLDANVCRECSEKFESENNLMIHFKERHFGKPYQCHWCENQLATFEELRLHVHSHNVEKYTCRECNKAYLSQEGYRKHRLRLHSAKFQCHFCGSEFLTHGRSILHEKKCKQNPDFAIVSLNAAKPSRIKQSRQLNWESRIIVRKIRGVAEEDEKSNEAPSADLEETEDSLSDRRGWFDDYYRTAEDTGNNDDTPGLEPEATSSASSDSSEDEGDHVEQEIDFNYRLCRICGLACSHEYELLHHFVKNHPGEIPHQCPYCEEKAPLFAQLKEHWKSHGIGLGVFHCGSCSKAFRSEARGRRHSARCRGDVTEWPSTKVCRNCGKSFQTKCGYKRHKKLSCKREKKVPVPQIDLPTHSDAESWHADDPEPEDLVHINVPEIPAPLPEPVQEITHSSGCKENEPKLPPPDKFPCRLCSAAFPFERGLVMHFKRQHPGLKPLICPECGIALADKLKEHLKTHGIGEEFVCELCGRRFNQKFMSKIHELWHEGIEYKCFNCKQKFLSEEKMARHISGAKCLNRQSLMKIPCEVCGRHYRSSFGLKAHYLTHTPRELRPVKNRMNCEFCGKWFDSNNGLQRHRRIHTGEKPFCCRFCPKAFAQEGNCKAHERLHTGESKPRKKKPEPAAENTIYVCVPVGTVLQ